MRPVTVRWWRGVRGKEQDGALVVGMESLVLRHEGRRVIEILPMGTGLMGVALDMLGGCPALELAASPRARKLAKIILALPDAEAQGGDPHGGA